MKRLLETIIICALLTILPGLTSVAQTVEQHVLTLDDIAALREVGDPQISPDGDWVAYTVRTWDLKEDKRVTHIWMTSWDGARTVRLTSSEDGEENPRWSPDNQYLAFTSGRGSEDGIDQIWLMNRTGGEAEKITDLKGSVTDYAWSPDSKRLAMIVEDPDPDALDTKDDKDAKDKKEKKTPKPIVIDRFQFKEDKKGYLGKRRQHLYLLDLATRKVEALTSGDYDEDLPAWSPDGSAIAFVSKRGKDFDRTENYDLYVIEARVGATPRQLTTYEGADDHPDWGSHPAWSPDGKYIAYLQGGPRELIEYAVRQLAVIPAGGGSPRLLTAGLDRNVGKPRWSADGASIYFLLEDDRVTSLAKVPARGGAIERVLAGRREIGSFDLGPNGKVAVLSGTTQEPSEVFALENGGPRPLSRQNQELLSHLKLATVEEISFKSKDGTTVNGFLVKPPDYREGQKYPTILRIHGGPVSQFTNEFMEDWQFFAANGYVVVAANPRGSSGRGQAYSKAIYADWGNKDAQDVLAAVDYAVARGIADPNRLGIGGWSYGGMLTNYTIAQDKRFKVAVSGASISNIMAGYGTDMYVRDYETELGTPWTHPEVWQRISFPFLHADRIVTPTLFLCGDKDFNVPLLNSEQMYQALRSLGRDTELIIYPGQFHEINKPSYLRDRLERYIAWYNKYLMPNAGASKVANVGTKP